MSTVKVTIETELKAINEPFETVFSNEYGNVFLLENKNILVCEFTEEYVPIEEFKQIFLSMSGFIEEYKINKIIFDKRALTTFHQPSMEWYFIVWKKELYESFGLRVHRKLLPQGVIWFKRAVEAGHAQIKKKHPANIIDKLDIGYRHTVKEAIES